MFHLSGIISFYFLSTLIFHHRSGNKLDIHTKITKNLNLPYSPAPSNQNFNLGRCLAQRQDTLCYRPISGPKKEIKNAAIISQLIELSPGTILAQQTALRTIDCEVAPARIWLLIQLPVCHIDGLMSLT